ncbi:MAG: DUF1232 domain-containing protein [SAR202 cluster bacterium]|nr:DUF1232 domain-containing protein [SAR202 cluster bacterium]
MSHKVSIWLKLPIILAIAYLISPLDIIPDFLRPGIGHLDDIIALIFGISIFINFLPKKILLELIKKTPKRNQEKHKVVDGKYKIIE